MDKKNKPFWCISLLVISIATLIWPGSNIIGVELPDTMVRILGVIDIIAVTILIYTTLKRKK